MKFRSLALILALVAGSPAAMAACTSSFNLGVISSPSAHLIGNGFGTPQHFEDCYNFSLDAPSHARGFTFEFDGSTRRDIGLTSVSLSGGGLTSSLVDTSPASFSFSNLLAGVYQFVVTGEVTGRSGGLLGGGTVGYVGAVATTTASVTTPVPEPQTYALLALGLVAVGVVVRRRNDQTL